jgi:hypothetical protein
MLAPPTASGISWGAAGYGWSGERASYGVEAFYVEAFYSPLIVKRPPSTEPSIVPAPHSS